MLPLERNKLTTVFVELTFNALFPVDFLEPLEPTAPLLPFVLPSADCVLSLELVAVLDYI